MFVCVCAYSMCVRVCEFLLTAVKIVFRKVQRCHHCSLVQSAILLILRYILQLVHTCLAVVSPLSCARMQCLC